MRWRYLAFDPRRHGREERFRQLRSIFNVLLTKSGGDVDQALQWMEMLGERQGWFDERYDFEDFKADLLREGMVRESRSGRAASVLELTGKGEKLLREQALERIFSDLSAGGPGEHRTPYAGSGGEATEETRPYSFGDSVDRIAWTRTLQNALARAEGQGPGIPLSWTLREDDLEVQEHERNTGCATVLLVDVSHSMVLYGEDRMTPAREVALALLRAHHHPLPARTPSTSCSSATTPSRCRSTGVPYIQAGPFHTNTKAGLQLAQRILSRRRHVNKQIFMITDGKPSAPLARRPPLQEPLRPRRGDRQPHPRRSGALPPRRYHHHHLHGRPGPDPGRVRRRAHPAQSRPRLLHRHRPPRRHPLRRLRPQPSGADIGRILLTPLTRLDLHVRTRSAEILSADPTRSPRRALARRVRMRTRGPCALGREDLGAPLPSHLASPQGDAVDRLRHLLRQGPRDSGHEAGMTGARADREPLPARRVG